MTVRLTYEQMRDAARAIYRSKRHHIEICTGVTNGPNKRPDEWFVEQRGSLEAVAQIGGELALIAANSASYEVWKATLPKGSAV